MLDRGGAKKSGFDMGVHMTGSRPSGLLHCTLARLSFALMAALAMASSALYAACPFNVSGPNAPTASSDGLLLLRAASFLTGTSLTSGAGTARAAADILNDINANRKRLDVDGDGEFTQTDALIIARYLAGMRDDALLAAPVSGSAIPTAATRVTGQAISRFIADGCVLPAQTAVNRADPYVFVDTHEVAPASVQTSNTVTISGLSAPAQISVSDGTYSIGCNATFTAATGTISNGQTVCVRHTAASDEGASINTTLRIATSQSMFASTTAYANPAGLNPVPPNVVSLGSYPAPSLTGALAPTIVAVADGAWSDPAIWQGNRVPVAGDIVSIPKGRAVRLAGNTASLGGLWIMGSLDFDRVTVALVSRYVFVYGRLQAGAPNDPFTSSAIIEFTGTDKTHSVMGMGTKGLVVMEGGLLKLHGERRLGWTQIVANAAAGATSIAVKDAPDTWRAGDRLVIAASAIDPRLSEVVTVTAVSGNTVSFTPALSSPRYATVQTYNGKRLDQRPSVSLLSRNIVMRGDAASDAIAFGGHVMIMANGHAQVSGVTFSKMGQRGFAARYPLHWHEAGDRAGSYGVSNSVVDSFQRAYVVHSTSNVLLDSNVAYNVSNHAYVWSEDGDESGNRLIRNLGLLTKSPDDTQFAFPITKPFFGNSSQGENRSATFWGRSFDRHVLRGNVSAGVIEGFSYFFDLFTPRPDRQGDEGSGIVFENNVAHSNYKILATGNQINYPEASTGHALFISTGTNPTYNHVFRNYTCYHNTSAAWIENRNTTLQNSILSDNGIGAVLLRGVVDGVTIVGKSATPVSVPQFTASVSLDSPSQLHIAGSNHGGKRAPVIRDATIINHTGTGVLWDVDNISPAAALGNVRFSNVANQFLVHDPLRFEYPFGPNWGWNDVTGRFAGDGVPARIVARDSNIARGVCKALPGYNAYSCPASDSMLLSSSTTFNIVDSNGKITYLRDLGYDYFDDSVPDVGAMSWVGSGERYEVLMGAQTNLAFSLGDAAGKSIELSFALLSAPGAVTHAGQPVAALGSLKEMRSSNVSARFFDAVSSRLYVRIVVPGTATDSQAVIVNASFRAQAAPGVSLLSASAPRGSLTSGFLIARYANSAVYGLRYGAPLRNATSTSTSNAPIIDGNASDAALAGTAPGTTTVYRAYVNAPVDGLYRLALWGDGGGTSVYVDGRYVMGESYAGYNSNYFTNNVPNPEVIPFLHPSDQVALKAGWHEVMLVHGKYVDPSAQQRLETSMMFRWATPQNPDLWVFPQVWRPQ
jgi:G8 domain